MTEKEKMKKNFKDGARKSINKLAHSAGKLVNPDRLRRKQSKIRSSWAEVKESFLSGYRNP